jgi:hypothetical protein
MMFRRRRLFVLTLSLAALVMSNAAAQAPVRRTTNVAALRAYPGFFHQRSIVLVAPMTRLDNGELRFDPNASNPIRIIYKGSVPDGQSEVRGEFWDLGRMSADDPRLAAYDVRATFRIDPDAGWPRPGQVTAIIASAVQPGRPAPSASVASASALPRPSLRSVVLYPERFLNEKITLVGQFAGRNLIGDLPDAPGQSRFDFVLRTTDAAVWVTNLEPKGRDFTLSLDTRVDTGRWIEVAGTLRQGRGLQWIDAQGSRVALTKAPTEQELNADQGDQEKPPPPPAPTVTFSAPTNDESDVRQSTTVRIQFSRDIDDKSFKDHIRVRYLDEEARANGEPDTPKVEFSLEYRAAQRVLEIKFPVPLERYRTVKVELQEGIVGTDRQPLAPWTLSFVTGPP